MEKIALAQTRINDDGSWPLTAPEKPSRFASARKASRGLSGGGKPGRPSFRPYDSVPKSSARLSRRRGCSPPWGTRRHGGLLGKTRLLPLRTIHSRLFTGTQRLRFRGWPEIPRESPQNADNFSIQPPTTDHCQQLRADANSRNPSPAPQSHHAYRLQQMGPA